MTPQELTSKLKAIAKEKGISTYRLAELTGIAQPNIYRTLSGKNNPNIDTLVKIARALDCEIEINYRHEPIIVPNDEIGLNIDSIGFIL